MPHSADAPLTMVELTPALPKVPDAGPPVAYGREMRSAHFAFAPTHIPINHGSYGAAPKPVLQVLREVQERSETRPDAFVHFELPRGQDVARARVAELLGTDADNVVLVPNASTGLDTVLRSLRFAEGDVILYPEGTYSALEKAALYIAETTPARVVKLSVHWPIADDALVQTFTDELARINGTPGQRVRLAIFDTVVSTPGIHVPWERLVAATRAAGALSLVDGAHGLGHLDLRHLGRVEPDFFTSKLHKWLSVPRPCAILYVPRRNQALIRTSVPTSHGFVPDAVRVPPGTVFAHPLATEQRCPFAELFGFVATADYAPQLCVAAALDWRALHGGEAAIMAQCVRVARRAGDRAAAVLGTEVMDCRGSSTRVDCALANIRLPIDVKNVKEELQPSVVPFLKRTSSEEKDAYVQAFRYREHYYWRVSGQIYLEEDEVVDVAEYLLGLCARVNDGRWIVECQGRA